VTPNSDGAPSLFTSITATPNAGSLTTTLTFNLSASQIIATGTTTIVSSQVTGTNTINGAWARLSALQPQFNNPLTSPITISIGTNGTSPPNNMFGNGTFGAGQPYSSSNPPPDSPAIGPSTGTNQVITVTFTYNGFYKPIGSPSSSFTLTIQN
jgi:hypothetical protein